jgi:hypothetical protein
VFYLHQNERRANELLIYSSAKYRNNLSSSAASGENYVTRQICTIR